METKASRWISLIYPFFSSRWNFSMKIHLVVFFLIACIVGFLMESNFFFCFLQWSWPFFKYSNIMLSVDANCTSFLFQFFALSLKICRYKQFFVAFFPSVMFVVLCHFQFYTLCLRLCRYCSHNKFILYLFVASVNVVVFL